MPAILITGASSGIGAALATAYAEPGTTLFLGGRHAQRLEAVADACRRTGATVETAALDVTDRDAMAAWVRACDASVPLTLAIANAGVSAGTGGDGESAAQARHVFAVNVDGTLNTLMPALEAMRPRRSGQLAIMASLAGFRGFPGAPIAAARRRSGSGAKRCAAGRRATVSASA